MWRHNSSAPGGRRDFFEAVRVGDWWGVFFSLLWWRRNKEAVGSVLKEFWNTSQKINTSKQISPCFIAFFVQFFCPAWSESFAREYVYMCTSVWMSRATAHDLKSLLYPYISFHLQYLVSSCFPMMSIVAVSFTGSFWQPALWILFLAV